MDVFCVYPVCRFFAVEFEKEGAGVEVEDSFYCYVDFVRVVECVHCGF